MNESYTVLEIDELSKETGQAVQDYLWEITNCRTVPRLFINQKCIGGCDDTRDLIEKDELKNFL